jgi:2-iminobutanoate/2-iminopropanoate deaminase
VNTPINPASMAAPAAMYSHAVLSEGSQRVLHTSGVVPTDARGEVSPDLGQQAHQVWSNLSAILAEGDMTVTDIVSVTTYVVAGHDLAAVMAARDSALSGHLAASTLVTVPALARPEWKLEISIVAAR